MHKKRVLILETEIAVSSVLASILKDEGYQCIVRETSQGLPELLLQFRPAGILIARRIPELGVVKAIELIRMSPFGRHTAIIYLTASGSSIGEARSAGANVTIFKPIDINKLLFTLGNFTNLN